MVPSFQLMVEDLRGNGLGEMLLKEHWKDAIRNNPSLQTLTLHILKENEVARMLYLKNKYIQIPQDPLLINETNGFGKWAKNCKDKDQWPLKKGIDLYGISLEEVQKII